MAVIDLQQRATLVAIAPTSSPTAAPTSGTDGVISGYGTRGFTTIRTLIDYAGTVNAAALRIWFRDTENGAWYAGASTDDLDPLAPGGASPVDESRDWSVGRGAEVYFQVTEVSGGGTVGVRVQGVQS